MRTRLRATYWRCWNGGLQLPGKQVLSRVCIKRVDAVEHRCDVKHIVHATLNGQFGDVERLCIHLAIYIECCYFPERRRVDVRDVQYTLRCVGGSSLIIELSRKNRCLGVPYRSNCQR